MHLIILVLVIIAIIFGPQWWARRVFKQYSKKQDHIPGTGGELARHLLDRFDMQHVKVEITEEGDHYDPEGKMVRLSPGNFNDNSLTAVAVAAHEVGHAIQDHQGDTKLALRTQLVKLADKFSKVGSVLMMVMPIAIIFTRSPSAGLIFMLAGLLSIAGAAIVHLITLPVEWDASFGKALPILEDGYIQGKDVDAVKRVLKAAALTYVSVALMSILNVWRWAAIFLKR